MHAVPVLLAILVVSLFSLLVWGFLQVRHRHAGEALMGGRDEVLTGLLVLAAFALGVFIAYLMIVVS